ncbi:MAG: hypothetical protein OZ921_12460 [Sorangiineae bacterium]|nr:hypothetical protein [Polyangiaceae bacterium]MEB2323319.1 hypothetical protein [Sorangiineae bacterium]
MARPAARLGRPFVEVDAQIEAAAGARVSEIVRAAGEAKFRRREAEELERALARSDAPASAVGGGALLERARRLDALERATVVAPEATPEEWVRRAEAVAGVEEDGDEAGVDFAGDAGDDDFHQRTAFTAAFGRDRARSGAGRPP